MSWSMVLWRLAKVFGLMLVGANAMAESTGAIPFKTDSSSAAPDPQHWVVALLLCAIALGAALFWLKRKGSGRMAWPSSTDSRMLQILDRKVLSPAAQIVVVRYQQRQLLLAVGSHGVQCLRDEAIVATGGAE